MKHTSKNSVLFFISLLSLSGCAGEVYAEEDILTWHSSYSAAIDEARRTKQPIFLEFRCAP